MYVLGKSLQKYELILLDIIYNLNWGHMFRNKWYENKRLLQRYGLIST